MTVVDRGSGIVAAEVALLADAFGAITAGEAPASLVVRRGSTTLLDVASGTDLAGTPFTTSTPVLLASAIKPAVALAALLAAADGALDLDDSVATHWPAFGAHGKGSVTVRHVLAHAAAVPGWREPFTSTELFDQPVATAALAASRPWWSPGEPGEHATSYGHLIDGVLRHATGRSLSSWWQTMRQVTGCDLALAPDDLAVPPAVLEDPGGTWMRARAADGSAMGRLLRVPVGLLDIVVRDTRGGPVPFLPAVVGYGAARDLARLWAWWVGQGGEQRLGRTLRDESLRPQVVGHDHVLDDQVCWGLGPQVDDGFIGMAGVGGCAAGYDPAHDLVIAFTTPRLSSLDRLDPLEAALEDLA